jgi:hypothetical protein
MGDAEVLFTGLNNRPQGMTIGEAQEYLFDNGKQGGQVSIVLAVLRDMIPENVVIQRHGIIRLATTFEDGKDWIFMKLHRIKQMSDNVERDIGKLLMHFPQSDIGKHLKYAMKASQLTSDAIANAIKLT